MGAAAVVIGGLLCALALTWLADRIGQSLAKRFPALKK